MHLNAGVPGFEVAGDAGNCPPGAGAGHEGMQVAARLAPDLGPGAQVRPEVRQVLKLICEERAAGLCRCLLRMESVRVSLQVQGNLSYERGAALQQVKQRLYLICDMPAESAAHIRILID